MGILDHNKTWRITLKAEPDRCLQTFSDALTGGKGVFSLKKAKWDVARHTSAEGHRCAIGVYQGRAGITGAITTMSERASSEEQGAVGSQIAFEVEGHDPATGTTTCAMWLKSATRTMGFKNDARFFRSYMNTVANRISELDPTCIIEKV